MVAITINSFIGEQPRIVPRRIPDSAAQSAVNTRLDDGALTPIRIAATESETSDTSIRTLFKLESTGQWFTWSSDVHAAPGPVVDERLYFTGDGVPKMKVGGTDYTLAVERPAAAVTASATGSGTGIEYTRLYVYTYVTGFGEESEPNPVSNEITWQSGQTVTLSGFAAPTDTTRNITKQRIYRSQTGQSGTYFYLIAERDVSTANFNDTVDVDDFQEALPSADYNTPAGSLEGLVPLPGGMMAAFTGRELHFCEPYQPHAWPEKYVLHTDYDIMAVRGVGSVLVVLTTGQPYIVLGASPAAMQMQKLEINAPCINKKAVVDLGYAVAFPSYEGLFIIDGSGAVSNATRNLFKREDWLTLDPATMVAGQLGGRYVAFYDYTDVGGMPHAGSLFIDTAGDGYLFRNATVTSACHFDIPSSRLYYVDRDTGNIMEVDAEDQPREELYWKSKEFVFPRPVSMAAIIIDADSTVSLEEQAAIDSENSQIAAANAATIATGDIFGAIGDAQINRNASMATS